MAENNELDLGEEKKSSRKLMILMVVILLLLLGGGGAAVYFMKLPPFDRSGNAPNGDEEKAGEAAGSDKNQPLKKEAHFHEFEPFIVNFPPGGGARLLQIAFSALSYDEDTVKTIAKHTPMIRNNLLLLLGRYKPADLQSSQGKEALRDAITREIQKVLDLQPEGGSIEAVFFTQFMMQ